MTATRKREMWARITALTERVAQMESRLAALEAANDLVQDDAGSGCEQIEINCQPPCAKCGVCNGHSPGCGLEPASQPRFTQDGRYVIDHELRQRTDCGSGSHAANTALVLNIYAGNIGVYEWEPVDPNKPRFTRDGNRVIDNELHRQTWFAAEDIADDALEGFTSGKSCICSVSWEPVEPEQPPAPEQPKRRRVWVNKYEDHLSCMCHESRKQAEQVASTSCFGQVQFIEILPGDGDVFAERDVLREQMERFAQNKDLGNNPARIARLTLERADKAKEVSDDN